MRLLFVGLRACLASPVPFPGEIEWCEEDGGGAVSKVSLLFTPTWDCKPESATAAYAGASGDILRHGVESCDAARAIAGLLTHAGFRAVSSSSLSDRKLLRSLLGLVGADCPPVLDLSAVQRMAVAEVFRDRPAMMPTPRVVDQMISQSAEAELYRVRERGPEPGDANRAWWQWRDVASRARMMKIGLSM